MKSRTPPPNQPAGWYPDPEGSGQLAYFDGRAWTDAKVASYDKTGSAPQPEPVPIAPTPSGAPALPRRPPTFLRPLYLYGGAARGLIRLGSRVSLTQYSVFLVANVALVAAAVAMPAQLGWGAFGLFVVTALVVSIPRLHDTDRGAAELLWLPALALPLIGWLQGIRLLRKLFAAGHLGTNRFGPPPI